jgi:anti-repressor protein
MDMIVFNFSGIEVRTVKKKKQLWWVANDVCSALKIVKCWDAILKLDDFDKALLWLDDTDGPQSFTIINESGLYALIGKSRKKEARKFKRWMAREVFPAVCKTSICPNVEKIEFSAAIENSPKTIRIGSFSKILTNFGITIGRKRLYAWLRENGYLMRNNEPYQKYVDTGIFTVSEKTWESPNGPLPYNETLISGKGQLHLFLKLRRAFGDQNLND